MATANFSIVNNTSGTAGPYNGQTISAKGTLVVNLPVGGFASDPNLLSDVLFSNVTIKIGAVSLAPATAMQYLSTIATQGMLTDTLGNRTSVPLDGVKATYSAAATFAPAASATDIFTIQGSSTKTIRIIELRVTLSQALTASSFPVSLIVRSAANTAGTSASVTLVPHDSTDSGATSVCKSYTANPTGLGAAVGTIRCERIEATASGGAAVPASTFYFGNKPSKAVLLRGTSQFLTVNLNANSASTAQVSVELTEE